MSALSAPPITTQSQPVIINGWYAGRVTFEKDGEFIDLSPDASLIRDGIAVVPEGCRHVRLQYGDQVRHS